MITILSYTPYIQSSLKIIYLLRFLILSFKFIDLTHKQMLPQMRYNTAKLSELVHKQKNYRLHVNSVDKIMNKNNDLFYKRDQQLRQLKDRKGQSFSYYNHKKSKEIGYVNQLLYSKIYTSSKIDKKYVGAPKVGLSQSFELLQEKINQRNSEDPEKQQQGTMEHSFVLRNHRQYSIHKSTLLERTRQNIRLAKKIVNPVITYKTDDIMKMADRNKNHKERIMRYEPDFAKTKVDLYVEKKMSLSMISRKKSDSSLSRSSSERVSPQRSPRTTTSHKLGFQVGMDYRK